MDLSRYISLDRIVFLRSQRKEGAIRELVKATCRSTPGLDPSQVLNSIWEREQLVNSWIAPGIALPHGRLSNLKDFIISIGLSKKGIDYNAIDGSPVHLLILILGNARDAEQHILLLAEIARSLREISPHQLKLSQRSKEDLVRLLTGDKKARPRAGRLKLSSIILTHAFMMAREVKARAIMLHADAVNNLDFAEFPSEFPEVDNIGLILITSHKTYSPRLLNSFQEVIRLPFSGLNRSNQLTLSLLLALSRGLIHKRDKVIGVFGIPDAGYPDTLMVIDVAREVPTLLPAGSSSLLEDVEPQVLEGILKIAMDLSREGREGKPVGATFVLGDHQQVIPLTHQMVINPFRGYRDEEKSLLDPSLEETLKEFSALDGAFILRGDGVILAAGAYLRSQKRGEPLPSGLGARHASAADITASTKATAVVLSQSTGRVSLFRGGKLIMALERPKT